MSDALAVTTGDPAGVGPELVVRLLDELRGTPDTIVVVSSREELRAGIERAGLDVTVDELLNGAGAALVEIATVLPGTTATVSADAGRWALSALERSLELWRTGEVGGLVFGPLNKSSLHCAGMAEPDEMRWFERRFAGGHVVSEVNVNDAFWTSRVTSHIPLRDVADRVTPDSVAGATSLLHRLLVAVGRPAPRLAVCALNPHAGENGLFGDEEITAIAPGVSIARDEGVDVEGPFPCDTLFRLGFDGTFDGIVTMYHDQGQIALKTRAFDGGVTLEAGLPMPICTPAHGTAFDIVGMGRASMASTRNAYRLARRLVDNAA